MKQVNRKAPLLMSSHKKRSLSVSTERLRLRGNMKKSELKNFIQVYSELKSMLSESDATIIIKKKSQKVRIEIKPWMYRFSKYLSLIKQTENNTVREIIRRSVEQGEKDLKVWQSVAVSESTYYRLKKQIVDKIYNLYILEGEVKMEEILKEKIE